MKNLLEKFDETTKLVCIEDQLYYVGINKDGQYGYYRIPLELRPEAERILEEIIFEKNIKK